jgi:hypothetical protein
MDGRPQMVADVGAFARAIDRRHEAAQSVVLRYRHALRLEADKATDARLKALFEATSVREGLRVVPLFSHRGVQVEILDETSLMHTRTLKSIDGCVTAAHCLLRGDRRVVFESGGNTGTALTAYGVRAGLETFLFLPSENLTLLDGRLFDVAGAHLIAVDDARDVKPAAAAFAAANGVRRIPELLWRYQASTFVGCFLLEHLLEHARYDVLAQSISAAFGPIGIYGVLATHRASLGRLPRFLGVQQAANCPMVRAWRADGLAAARRDGRVPAPARPVDSTAGLLARVMYDDAPLTYGTFEELRRLLEDHGGDLTTVDRAEFSAGLLARVGDATVLEHLARAGIAITIRDGDVLEKAGLLGLVGTLREIESGAIPEGSRVLVCLTGGTARPDGRADPERRIRRGTPAPGAFPAGRLATATVAAVGQEPVE